MGKLHSIFSVRGKVGQYVYYKLNGKEIVRRAAGKRKGPMTKGERERALLNKEFGKASTAGKYLRRVLGEELEILNEQYFYQRLNKLMMQLRNCDPAAPGERKVAEGMVTEKGQKYFSGFLFHKKVIPFSKLMRAESKGNQLYIEVSDPIAFPSEFLEIQINFDNGKFRKFSHTIPTNLKVHEFELKRKFRNRKGFINLLFISGKGFLHGRVVCNI